MLRWGVVLLVYPFLRGQTGGGRRWGACQRVGGYGGCCSGAVAVATVVSPNPPVCLVFREAEVSLIV